jgi:hypothetical protein
MDRSQAGMIERSRFASQPDSDRDEFNGPRSDSVQRSQPQIKPAVIGTAMDQAMLGDGWFHFNLRSNWSFVQAEINCN